MEILKREAEAAAARKRMQDSLRVKAARGRDNPAFVRLMRAALGERTESILGWN